MIIESVRAVEVLPEELAEARRWERAKFGGVEDLQGIETGLNVLTGYCSIGQNRQGDLPLKIGEKVYSRGVYLHAPTQVRVRLPGPGTSFKAHVGICTNHMTASGKGTVICSVTVAGEEKFRSGVLREGMPGEDVEVDLGGAAEFTIETGDGGDGVACDQSVWADARALLADGREAWLGDLPARWIARGCVTADPPFSFNYAGKPSADFLKTWTVSRSTRELEGRKTESTLTYADPLTGLKVRSVATAYHDFPTVEWTLAFVNGGASDTPLIADIRSIDIRLERMQEGEFTLHHHTGSPGARVWTGRSTSAWWKTGGR